MYNKNILIPLIQKIEIMNRKTKKNIRQFIKDAQANGQSNKEIYDKLYEEYDEIETIARLIVTTVKPKDKKKHYLYLAVLFGFTAIVVLFNVWVIRQSPFPFIDIELYRFMYNSGSYMAMVWSAGGSYLLCYALVLNAICNKRITPYIFWMFTYSYLILYFLSDVFITCTFEWGIYLFYTAIDILSIISIIFLARFFQRKIFPDYRYRRLKEDEDGEYIFS